LRKILEKPGKGEVMVEKPLWKSEAGRTFSCTLGEGYRDQASPRREFTKNA
jgi:hypothetical protein